MSGSIPRGFPRAGLLQKIDLIRGRRAEIEETQLETSGVTAVKISVAAEMDRARVRPLSVSPIILEADCAGRIHTAQELRLVGAIPSLGGWNPSLGVPFQYNALEQRYCVELYSSDAMSTECKVRPFDFRASRRGGRSCR